MLKRRSLLLMGGASLLGLLSPAVAATGSSSEAPRSGSRPIPAWHEHHEALIAHAREVLRCDVMAGRAAPQEVRTIECPVCSYPLTVRLGPSAHDSIMS